MVAALVMGNVVMAKPAEQTSYCAFFVFKLLLQAGLPPKAASLILGQGEKIGTKILSNKHSANL